MPYIRRRDRGKFLKSEYVDTTALLLKYKGTKKKAKAKGIPLYSKSGKVIQSSGKK